MPSQNHEFCDLMQIIFEKNQSLVNIWYLIMRVGIGCHQQIDMKLQIDTWS